MHKSSEEHKKVQQDINKWRDKVGSIDSKGWYPYSSVVVTDNKAENQFKSAPHT